MTIIPEIAEAPTYPHGVVRGRYLRAVADTPADPGREMDWRPAEGKVTFTPVVPMRRAGVPVPALFTQQAVVCNLDPQGYLTDQAGERHVHLIAGQYKVRFDIRQFRVPGPRIIEVTPEHTVDNPLDLVLAMEEPPPPPGTVIVVDESTALRASRSAQEASAAADRAEDAAAQAETSATTVGDAAAQAREAATSARDSATSARDSATTAGAAAGRALESAADTQDAARATAEQAATATESATSAGAAADRAGSAETKATQAAARAESAATTATESAGYAEAAASRAATTADAAQESAKSAEESATTTSGHVASASASASRAESAAEDSESSAARASQSADTAASKAGDAGTASTTATDAASRAAKSATQADASATSAAESATSAAQSATRAGSAADTLNADAREFGDAVRAGTFTGDAGPANVLSIGTVSTLPPGSQATASISGESPSQVLNLGLVEGPEGKASTVPGPPGAVPTAEDYLIIGPGRPDQPATTNGAITGSEPVGARYESVDEAGVGARTWRKVPGDKWIVTDGDTGWRKIARTDSWTDSNAYYLVRRTNAGVTFITSVKNVTGSVVTWPDVWAWSLASFAGFRPTPRGSGQGVGLTMRVGDSAATINSDTTRWTTPQHAPAGQTLAAHVFVQSDDPWPSAPLPGSPA